MRNLLVVVAAVVSSRSMVLSGAAQAARLEKEKERKKRSTKWRIGVVFIFLFVGCAVMMQRGGGAV